LSRTCRIGLFSGPDAENCLAESAAFPAKRLSFESVAGVAGR
jgi:hypothetical protein